VALDTTNSLVSLDDCKEALGVAIGHAQIVDVSCAADVATSLDGTYFIISSINVDYYVWFYISAADPAVAGRTGIKVTITANASASTVAAALNVAINLITGFTAVRTGVVIRITNDDEGTVTAAADGDTDFTVSTEIEGLTNDPEFDNILNTIINRVSWHANKGSGRELKARSQTEYYDAAGGIEMYLDNSPASGLTLYQDSDRTFASGAIIASGDFVLYEDSGRIVLTGTTFSSDYKTIKAEYTGGYSTVPYDLQEACIEEVARLFSIYRTKSFIATSRSTDLTGTTGYKESGLSEGFHHILDGYKKMKVL